MASINMQRMLGAASLAVLALILFLGLWPNRPLSSNGTIEWWTALRLPGGFFASNQVRWLEGERGLQFGDYGSVFSATEFALAHNSRNFGIEVWMEPGIQQGPSTI